MLFREFDGFEGLVLIPCSQIHTFFMSRPIDAVFFDRSGKVLKVCSGVEPGNALPRVRHAYGVLELPGGGAARRGITDNTVIAFGSC